MNILEKEIEDLVYEVAREDTAPIRERGFPMRGKVLRQVDLGSYGIADLITFRFNSQVISLQIIEIKRDDVNAQTLMQAARYAKGAEIFMNKHYPHLAKRMLDIEILLLGKKIDLSGDFPFLLDYTRQARAYTFSLDVFTGLRFLEHKGFVKTIERETFAIKKNICALKTAYSNE